VVVNIERGIAMPSKGKSNRARVVVLFLFAMVVGTFSGYLSRRPSQAAAAPTANSCVPYGRGCRPGGTKCCSPLHCAFDGYTYWCRY
jgi:hypothetical protein